MTKLTRQRQGTQVGAYRRAIFEDEELSPTQRLVALAIAEHADYATGEGARPSKARLAKWTGLHPKTIRRIVAQLEEAGWIRRHLAVRGANTYELIIPSGDPPSSMVPPTEDGPSQDGTSHTGWEGGPTEDGTPPPTEDGPYHTSNHTKTKKEEVEGERTFLEWAREIMERAEPPDYTPRTPRRAGDDCPEVQAFEREIDQLKEEEDGLVGHLTRLVETHQDAIKLYTRRKDRAALTASKLEVVVSTLRFYDRPADEVRDWLTHKVGELVSREVGLHIWHKALTNYEDMRCWVEDQRERRKRRPEERPIEYLKDPFDVSHLL